MNKHYVTSTLMFIMGISVGVFFNLNDTNNIINNDTTKNKQNKIESIQTLQETKTNLVLTEPLSKISTVVNNISLYDLKSSFREIALELLQEQEKNRASVNNQHQNFIKKTKATLSATQVQQQKNNIELAKSYISRAISDGFWSNSDVYDFQTASSKIPTAELIKILSPFYIAINSGSIVPENGTMLF